MTKFITINLTNNENNHKNKNIMKTLKPIYNGYNLRQILSSLPKGMIKQHRNLYVSNCFEVQKNEEAGINKGYCEAVRNSNFNLIQFYLNNK